MGQIAKQAAEELLQSSRTELAPLEELERTREEFRRRVEDNLNQLPGFDPAEEVKRRNLQQATEQLVEARKHFEAVEKGAQQAFTAEMKPDVLVNLGRLPKTTIPDQLRMTWPKELAEAQGHIEALQPRMRTALLLVIQAKKLKENVELLSPKTTVDWQNFSKALASFEDAVYSEAEADPEIAELAHQLKDRVEK